jgi:hypothetical protein
MKTPTTETLANNIIPFTRWITNVDDYEEEILTFEKKASAIVNKYWGKMTDEIRKEIKALNKETEIEWDCWIDTIDDISVLHEEGAFKSLIIEESLQEILKHSNQE